MVPLKIRDPGLLVHGVVLLPAREELYSIATRNTVPINALLRVRV